VKLDTSVDYYTVLGIKPSATVDDIKRAYRQMVFRYHPDRNPDNSEAADKFNQVRDAYAVLSDALKRRAYDGINHPAGAEESEEPAEERPEEKEEHAANGNGHGSTDSSFFKQEFKQQKIESEPKCPSCSVVGIEHIVSRKGGSSSSRGKQFVLSPFNVVLCDACGHVYGVTGNSS
jgi:DnaJ-class molecular chaperone